MSMFLLLACPAFNTFEPYYDDGPKPAVSAITPTFEVGTVGGQEVTITGQNFGTSASQLMVQFASSSAEIVAVTDTSITVIVPPGPMTGGAVDVRIATPDGYTIAKEMYTYDVGTTYINQRAYIQINNFIAGQDPLGMGTSGSAEAFNFYSARYHTTSVGFWGVADVAPPTWQIETPAISKFAFGVEDLHEDFGSVYLTNADMVGSGYYCVDATGRATAADTPGECVEGTTSYAADTLNFCTYADAIGVPTNTYEADWPAQKDFFSIRGAPSNIVVNLPIFGIQTPITLPEPMEVTAEAGFEDLASWTSSSFTPCFDDDVAVAFSWAPSEAVYTPIGDGSNGSITGQQTWVQFAFDLTPLGWLGISTPLVRAVITVPDSYNEDRGLSHLEVPPEVLSYFPSVATPGGLSASAYDPAKGYGYMFVSAIRFTDYAIHADKLNGDIVVSYATGDIGITGWTNPEDGCIQ